MGTKAPLWTLLLMLVRIAVASQRRRKLASLSSSPSTTAAWREQMGQTHHLWSWVANWDNEAFLSSAPATGAPHGRGRRPPCATHKLRRHNTVWYSAKHHFKASLKQPLLYTKSSPSTSPNHLQPATPSNKACDRLGSHGRLSTELAGGERRSQ